MIVTVVSVVSCRELSCARQDMMEILFYNFLFLLLSGASGKVSLYLSSDQTEALYGIKTPGLYYITEGVVNKYAMNFQHQVQF